jgi:hypothetical protein
MNLLNKLIFLGLMASSVCFAAAPNSSENARVIRQTLDEFNETFFSPRSLRVDLLKNYPELIPTLANWEYEAWRVYNTSLTPEIFLNLFNKRLNDDAIPLTFVLFRDNEYDHHLKVSPSAWLAD